MLSSISENDAAIGAAFDVGISHCYILYYFMPITVLLADGGLVEANFSVVGSAAEDCLTAGLDGCEMAGSRLAESVACHVCLDGGVIVDVDDEVDAV